MKTFCKKKMTTTLQYWICKHSEFEHMRLAALKRGEEAMYGYWKPKGAKFTTEITESNNTIPVKPYWQYKLDCTYKQANEAIRLKESPVGLFVKFEGVWHNTYKNALKLPSMVFIRDINNRICFFNGKKFIRLC
jgi:hypothetical protein